MTGNGKCFVFSMQCYLHIGNVLVQVQTLEVKLFGLEHQVCRPNVVDVFVDQITILYSTQVSPQAAT